MDNRGIVSEVRTDWKGIERLGDSMEEGLVGRLKGKGKEKGVEKKLPVLRRRSTYTSLRSPGHRSSISTAPMGGNEY